MKTTSDDIYLSNENGGVLVEHSVLSLEAQSSECTNFISSAGPAYISGKLFGKQVLVSDESYRLLSPRFPKTAFLPCQYFRPIVLGNIQLELLPSGESPGASFLRIQKKDDSLFYASHWSRQNSAALRRSVFKTSKTLMVRLHKDPNAVFSVTARRETERFLDFSRKIINASENLVAVVNTFGEAQNLSYHLDNLKIPYSFDSKLHAVMKSFQETLPAAQCPSWLKEVNRYNAESPSPSVILVSKQHLLQSRPKSLPDGIWVWIGLDSEEQLRHPWLSCIAFTDTFLLQDNPDITDLLDMIKEVNPQQILLFGEGAQNCATVLARQGLHAECFSPPRLQTLF